MFNSPTSHPEPTTTASKMPKLVLIIVLILGSRSFNDISAAINDPFVANSTLRPM
jgi:hypothetical protein